MNANDIRITISIISLFLSSIIATPCVLYIELGTFIMYIQSFASGSFLGISILSFLKEASVYFENGINGFVMVGVFALFFLTELITLHKYESNQHRLIPKIADDSRRNYSDFLMHRFSAFTSPTLQLIFFIIFFINSIIVGFAIYIYIFNDIVKSKLYYLLLLSILVEKFIENFSLTAILQNYNITKFTIAFLSTLYSLLTPLTLIVLRLCSYDESYMKKKINGYLILVSTGIFMFIGLLFWRKSFLTPFEWKKKEIVLICFFFFVGLLIQAVACIGR